MCFFFYTLSDETNNNQTLESCLQVTSNPKERWSGSVWQQKPTDYLHADLHLPSPPHAPPHWPSPFLSLLSLYLSSFHPFTPSPFFPLIVSSSSSSITSFIFTSYLFFLFIPLLSFTSSLPFPSSPCAFLVSRMQQWPIGNAIAMPD